MILSRRSHAFLHSSLSIPRVAHRCLAVSGRCVDVATSPAAAASQRNVDPEAVFVVSGASRGLGLEFSQQLLDRTAGTVVACCRNPEASVGLQALAAAQPSRLKLVQLDLSSQAMVDAAAAKIKDEFGRVDLLLNVAGILHDPGHPKAPERKLADVNREWLAKTLEVNAMGPVLLTKALEPLLRHPRATGVGSPAVARAPSVVASVSARVGSIGDNGLGGWYSYRMSKAALNMATRTLALELGRSNIWVISLHPGTTDTDLSKPFQGNVRPEKLFTTAHSVKQMLAVVEGLDKDYSGGFYAFDGSAIPW